MTRYSFHTGDMSCVEALGPPVNEGSRPNQIGTGQQRYTASGLGVFELLNGGETAIHRHRNCEQPQMLWRLELGRVDSLSKGK
jgi:hypothetical protein